MLIHTGQHYDANLSDVFFDELEMKRPEISLEVGSGKHGAQTARILERFEAVLEQGLACRGSRYQRVVVVGDVNSTVAATLAAVKLGVPVAHVEAGLRSFDRTMPEEINRIVTDSISDMLFVSEPAGMENLRREGHPEANLHLVGNVMIDSLLRAAAPGEGDCDTLQAVRDSRTANTGSSRCIVRPMSISPRRWWRCSTCWSKRQPSAPRLSRASANFCANSRVRI